MKTIESAKKQSEMYSNKPGIVFSYETDKGIRYGWCLLSSPLYRWVTEKHEADMFSGYKNPKLIEDMAMGSNRAQQS